MSAQHAPSAPQATTARIVGLLVFLGGIGLLIFVFVAANTLFNAPPPTVPAPAPRPPGADAAAPSAAIELGRGFSLLVQKILLLLLMCVAGSLIASKGIQLFFAAGAVPVPPAPARPEPAIPPPDRQTAAIAPPVREPAPAAKSKTGEQP